MDAKKIKWHKIADPGEEFIKEGLVLNWSVPGKTFCLTFKEGKYYAFSAKCPHAGAEFVNGYIDEKNCIVCPLHRFRFNIKTGVNTSGEGFYLIRYPILEDERGVFVGIEEGK